MSRHDRLEEGFRALRAVTEAGLQPLGTADAVMRYRKRRARRALAVSVVAIAALSVALQGSLGSRHPRQECVLVAGVQPMPLRGSQKQTEPANVLLRRLSVHDPC